MDAPTLELVDPRTLNPHPQNPRQGDIGAIVESITGTGWHGVVVGQKSSGQVIAGWHRASAAGHIIDALDRVRDGWEGEEADRWREWAEAHADDPVVHGVIPVEWQDLDDETAMRKLLADNRTNDLAAYNDHDLTELLSTLAQTPEGLFGTAWHGDDLDALLEAGEAPALEDLDSTVEPREGGMGMLRMIVPQDTAKAFRAALNPLGETDGERLEEMMRRANVG